MPQRPPRGSSTAFDARRRKVLAVALSALGAPHLAALAAADNADAANAVDKSDDSPADPADPAATAPVRGVWTHAYAAFGKPKYPASFTHFDYAEPAAKKGGTLYLRNPDRRTTFDKFNPFTLRGLFPAGIVIYMFESLAVLSGDEPQTMYGLLAEALLIAPDLSSVTIRLHPKARFANGDPVTAADVKKSFEAQASKFASPLVQSALAVIASATVLDVRSVRFDLKERSTDAVFTVGGLSVFSAKWLLGTDGQPRPLDQVVTDYPITTGPYTIASTQSGRRLEFKRNPAYWARDLPPRRGFFNFDRVVYRYYSDNDVAREAFKAGEFDILKEYSARNWVRQHAGPKWASGQIIKDPFPTAFGEGQSAFDFNLRRPKFQDIRVREAVALSYDFKHGVNRYGQYTRGNSMFANTDFAAVGLPSTDELKLLEPFRAQLPTTVFGPAFVAPVDDTPAELRKNLLRARDLFSAAGWRLAADGRLRNAAGIAFEFEYMRPGSGAGNESEWQLNLRKLGARINLRDVDYALYQRRTQDYDFDMIAIVEGVFTLPPVSNLVRLYGSKSADEKGNANYRGVKSPAVDALLAKMATATTLAELRTASRALDRVVMWNWWQVPGYYTANERASYWNKFGMPKVRPLYYTIESSIQPQPAWPITTWWIA